MAHPPLHDELLARTLVWAKAGSAFYRRHLDGCSADTAVRDLARLPLLTKEVATTYQQELRCGPQALGLGTFSSGTTGAALLRMEHSAGEDEALRDYLTSIGYEPTPRRILEVVSPNHGYPGPAKPAVVRLLWAPYPSLFSLLEDALRSEICGRRIDTMSISLSALKEATAHVLHQRIDARTFGVGDIYCNGSVLTPRWRRLVGDVWGAQVHDQYGLSEFRTLATECPTCGYFHFGLPPIVTEVIDPISCAPLAHGVGELVLTGLYPFVQRQPLIRFRTGDLVELGPTCATRPEDFSLRPLGRVRDALIAGGNAGAEISFVPSLLENLVDDYAEVARHPSTLEKLFETEGFQTGQPKIAAERDNGGVRLCVGVVFVPELFPERATELARTIVHRYRGAHRALLGQQAAELSLHVELLAPGARAPRWIRKYAV
ncbi:MAG: hypothetical protein AAB426_06240 [Myxococcota bacterium]